MLRRGAWRRMGFEVGIVKAGSLLITCLARFGLDFQGTWEKGTWEKGTWEKGPRPLSRDKREAMFGRTHLPCRAPVAVQCS